MENLKERAIKELIAEGRKQGENVIALNAKLRNLQDNSLFAYYLQIFGYPVGTPANSIQLEVLS